jgi:outer membrane protein assembly factor BamB
VKWRTTVGEGSSSPILSGDRVFMLSEPGVLSCLSAADGKMRWTARITEDLPPEILGNMHEPPGTKERARATPATDGVNVYAALGNGVVACYSLEGRRVWVQYVEPAQLTYGPSASPVLVGGTLLVDSSRLRALEAATGRSLWKAGEGDPHYGTPALLSLGGTLFAVTSKGAVIRVSDGVVLANQIARGLGGDQAPSPIVHEDVAYFAYRRTSAVKLSFVDGRIRGEKLWEQELPGDVISSPVLKDGRIFVIPYDFPVCLVLEAKTGRILLEKETDLAPNIYPSLSLAGNRLYVSNDKGDTVVLEATAEGKVIRRNQLPEGSGASPAFSGSHLYLRGGGFLYCIGP